MTPEQIAQVIAEYDRLVSANTGPTHDAQWEVAHDDTGEVFGELCDVAERLFALDLDLDQLQTAKDAYCSALMLEINEDLEPTADCRDCGRRVAYNWTTEQYQHMDDPRRGCFTTAGTTLATPQELA